MLGSAHFDRSHDTAQSVSRSTTRTTCLIEFGAAPVDFPAAGTVRRWSHDWRTGWSRPTGATQSSMWSHQAGGRQSDVASRGTRGGVVRSAEIRRHRSNRAGRESYHPGASSIGLARSTRRIVMSDGASFRCSSSRSDGGRTATGGVGHRDDGEDQRGAALSTAALSERANARGEERPHRRRQA